MLCGLLLPNRLNFISFECRGVTIVCGTATDVTRQRSFVSTVGVALDSILVRAELLKQCVVLSGGPIPMVTGALVGKQNRTGRDG
jgi:hypothetical protein